MGTKGLDALVMRAVQDSDFRNLLESKPEEAFSGFDLTSEEKVAVRRAQRHLSMGEMNPEKIAVTLNAHVVPLSSWR